MEFTAVVDKAGEVVDKLWRSRTLKVVFHSGSEFFT
jgi:hypothetical protein